MSSYLYGFSSGGGVAPPSGVTPLAAWRFNLSLVDSIGSQTFTNNGDISYTIGKLGQGLASNNGVTLDLGKSLLLDATSFSISVWVVLGDSDCLLVGQGGVSIEVIGGKLNVSAGGGPLAASVINNSAWHHVVLTFDFNSGLMNVYVDGAFITSGTDTLNVTGNFLLFGTAATGPELDELYVYSGTVLTLAQVQSLYNGGAGAVYTVLQ